MDSKAYLKGFLGTDDICILFSMFSPFEKRLLSLEIKI
jgi:hypothetical protein